MINRPLAFLKRDYKSATSYRLNFTLQICGMILSILTFFFISRLFDESSKRLLKEYGGDYFSYVLIGIAFTGYLGVGLSSFSSGLAQEQSLGTLEAMLITPTRLSTILLSMSIWSFLLTSINTLLFLAFGAIFLGVNVSHINLGSALLTQALTVICFASLGIMSASFIMVLKRGDPINWIFGGVSALLGGVYFPIGTLPKALAKASSLLPITYALRAARLSVLQGYGIKELKFELGMLVGFSLVFIPLSMLMFRWAIRRARIDGSLMHY